MNILELKNKLIIMLRKGEIDGVFYTFEQIGEVFGLSRQRTHQVYDEYKKVEEKTNSKK